MVYYLLSLVNSRKIPNSMENKHFLLSTIVSLFAGLVPVSDLGHMVSIGTLLAFVLVCIGVMVMSKKMPDAPRTFKTPWVPFVPVAVSLYV